jgi:hypothetical protein
VSPLLALSAAAVGVLLVEASAVLLSALGLRGARGCDNTLVLSDIVIVLILMKT